MFLGMKPATSPRGICPAACISHTRLWSNVSCSSLPPRKPINAAVADVRHQGRARQQHQHAARRAHALELGVGLAAFVDVGVGSHDGPCAGPRPGQRSVHLAIRVGHAFAGHLAGQLAGGVGAHAVGHHQQMPEAMPVGLTARKVYGE